MSTGFWDALLVAFVELRGSYFTDKAKNRKEEFPECWALRDAFMQVCRRYFVGVDPEDIAFLGFMTRSHVSQLQSRIRADMGQRRTARVEVAYRSEGNEVRFDVRHLQ